MAPLFCYMGCRCSLALFFYKSGIYASYRTSGVSIFHSSPIQIALSLWQEFINTISISGFTAWFRTFGIFNYPINSASFWLTTGLAAIGFVLTCLYLTKIDLPVTNPNDDQWAWQALVLGLSVSLPAASPHGQLACPWVWHMIGTALWSQWWLARVCYGRPDRILCQRGYSKDFPDQSDGFTGDRSTIS